MRGELETGTDCYILTPISSDHSSTFFSSWLGCSTVGHWRPKALYLPLALTPASCPSTDSNCNWSCKWLTQAVSRSPASLGRTHLPPSLNSTTSTGQGDILISSTRCTCFAVLLLITQVHLLIDGSVEGQYITLKIIPYICLIWIILSTINHLFAHSLIFSSIGMYH